MAKIMLVEDDANLQSIYGDRLTAEGHTIISARDGEEALSLAMKEKPDLIISDIMMPKISGFDMLDILRTTPETKNIKIIMMTALSQAEDKERADKLGADKYLVKSQVTLDDVARVVNETIKEMPAPTAEQTDGGATPSSTPVTTTPMTEPTIVSSPVVSAPDPVVDPPADQAPATDTPALDPPTLPTDPLTSVSPASDPAQDITSPVSTPITVVDTAAPEKEVVSDSVPSVTEQAAISSQIDEFLAKNLPDTPTHAAGDDNAEPPSDPSVTSASPEAPTVTEEPSAPPAEQSSEEFVPPNEDGIIPPPVITATPPAADLPSPSPSPEESVLQEPVESEKKESTPVAPVESAPTTEPTPPQTAGERVIQPLSSDPSAPVKPSIMDLYDKEVAKEIADAPVPTPETGSVIAGSAEPAPQEQPPAPNDPHAIAL